MAFTRTRYTRLLKSHERHFLWKNVHIQGYDDCWWWYGTVDRDDYGVIGQTRVHRIIWNLFNRTNPAAGAVIRHTCDSPGCCNPTHLRHGSQGDNVRDRVNRNRSAVGESNGRAKLTRKEATAIQVSAKSPHRLATEHGVDSSTIRAVKKGKTWR
ncbi:HNH endonuclease [Burkholderia ubonensis]|uniref:HNH endonuclease n=1 Tax=Burkholderia ubonensis TaxID=101571 RepID=UPI000A8388DD|nr:HNH endonuclease [Burkholderia ubonensis]